MAELANCSRCDSVFVKGIRDICDKCYQEEENAFQIVYNYLRKRKNRKATLAEIVEDTGVDEATITKFVKEKRLLTSQFPNLGYPCERCGKMITLGKLCSTCSEDILTEWKRQDVINEREEQRQERLKSQERVYYTMRQQTGQKNQKRD